MLDPEYLEALELVSVFRIKYLKPVTGNSHFLIDKREGVRATPHTYAWLRDNGYIEVLELPKGMELPAAAMVSLTEKGRHELEFATAVPIDTIVSPE